MNKPLFFSLFLISGLIVSYGTPLSLTWVMPFVASIGFGLLWLSLREIEKKSFQFFLAFLWFTGTQLIQLWWMVSIEYQGIYIVFVWVVLSALLGIFFAAFSFLVLKQQTIRSIFQCAFIWTLFEWSKYFFFCGFPFNSLGESLTLPTSIGFISLGGILLLSFWVMLTNICAYKTILGFRELKKKQKKFYGVFSWMMLALIPYLYTFFWNSFHSSLSTQPISLALVQTGLQIKEKIPLHGLTAHFIHPLDQWARVFTYLKKNGDFKSDLLVFPEETIPFNAYAPMYSFSKVFSLVEEIFGQTGVLHLPPLKPPHANFISGNWYVSNAYLSQFSAQIFKTTLVIGLSYKEGEINYASAFSFSPHEKIEKRYDKQLLLPLVEYIPFSWCKNFLKKFGINEFYTRGKSPVLFSSPLPFAISICYENTLGSLVRKKCLQGAEFILNINNCGWFPRTSLGKIFFHFSKMRAAENGIYIMTAANSGITGIASPFGQEKARLDIEENEMGICRKSIDICSFITPYRYFGNRLIVIPAIIFLLSTYFKSCLNCFEKVVFSRRQEGKLKFFVRKETVKQGTNFSK